jgi:hypothetical protein
MLLSNCVFLLFAAFVFQAEATPSKPLIWAEEFDSLNFSTWTPLITGWRGGNNEFQYYTNRSENM